MLTAWAGEEKALFVQIGHEKAGCMMEEPQSSNVALSQTVLIDLLAQSHCLSFLCQNDVLLLNSTRP